MESPEYAKVIILDAVLDLMLQGRESEKYCTRRSLLDSCNKYLASEKISVPIDIFDDSLDELIATGLMEVVETPHAAPRLFINRGAIQNFSNMATASGGDGISDVYWHYGKLGRDWLIESFANSIGRQVNEIAPDSRPIENIQQWSPLKIERPDEKLDRTVQSLSELEASVRAENGYAATEPAERDEVLSRIQAGINYLNSASLVTATSVEVYLVWPFQKLLARFPVDTVIGAAATLSASVVREWLKGLGVKVLSSIFNLPGT
jgi:hypothetical protein